MLINVKYPLLHSTIGLYARIIFTILLLYVTGNNCNAALLKQQDDIEFVEGDFLADASGAWENPMTWRKFDGNQFSDYGISGIPNRESTAYIQWISGPEILITCNESQEIKNLIVLPKSTITLNQVNHAVILSIFGDLNSSETALLNSSGVSGHYLLKGSTLQNLKLSGSLGTNTQLVISGNEVKLEENLRLTRASSTLKIQKGILDFNNFNVAGLGNFILENLGVIKITSPDGINLKPLPPGIDPSFLNKGNVINAGSRTFSQAATFWYVGQTEQETGYAFSDNSTGKKIIIDNPTMVRLSQTTGIGPTGKLEIVKGIFEETNEAFIKGIGALIMLNASVYRTRLNQDENSNADVFPKLKVSELSPESTIELGAAGGTQRIDGNIHYQNLTFSGGGVKKISSAATNISGTVSIHENAILDVENKAFGNIVTNFTMTGGVFRTSKLNSAQPEMDGAYNITGGTVEFYGTNFKNTQTLRGGKNYHNITINANAANVDNNNVSFGTGIINVSGLFKVVAPAVFRIGGGNGQYITGDGHFIIEDGATFKYGNAKGITTANCGTEEHCGNIRTKFRSFSENASYGFTGTSANMVSGNGLPASVKKLYIQRSNNVTLSQNIFVEDSIKFSGTGNLKTIENVVITLSPTGKIEEFEDARLIGVITTTRDVEFDSDFGGMGLEILAAQGIAGITTLTRTTGIAIKNEEGHESILRYFEILPSESDILATIRFKYFHGELNGIEEENLKLFQADEIDGDWDVIGGDVNATKNFLFEENISEFNFITAASIFRSLPVELVSFSGQMINDMAVLIWETASEKNNDYFSIEKSIHNSDFKEINTIPGAGTSTDLQNYTYTDSAFNGSAFYRIKQADLNGDVSYSKTILLKQERKKEQFKVFPNPVDHYMEVINTSKSKQKRFTIKVYDVNGIEILVSHDYISDFNDKINLKLPQLAKGMYFIKIITDKESIQLKFIKN